MLIAESQRAYVASVIAYQEYRKIQDHCDVDPRFCIVNDNYAQRLSLLDKAIGQDAERYNKQRAAIIATMAAYHVHVEGQTFDLNGFTTKAPLHALRTPHDPEGRGGWTNGLPTAFVPLPLSPFAAFFKDDSDPFDYGARDINGQVVIYPRDAIDGSGTHYMPGHPYKRDRSGRMTNESDYSAETFPDGHVLVYQEAFDSVLCEARDKASCVPNPGRLASRIYHELQHYKQLVEHGDSAKELQELNAYRAQDSASDIFELDAVDKQAVSDGLSSAQRSWENARDVPKRDSKPNPYHSVFPSQEDEMQYGTLFGDLRKERVELLEQQASLRRIVATEKSARERERRAKEQKRREEERRRLPEELRLCGLQVNHFSQPDGVNPWPGFVVFVSGTAGVRYQFGFKGDITLAQAKTIMLLAKACIDAAAGLEPELCNDGLELAGRSWGDADFRAGIQLDAVNVQGSAEARVCFDHVRDNLAFPTTVDGFARLVRDGARPLQPHIRDLQRYYRDAKERNRRVQEENRRIMERNEREHGGGRGGGCAPADPNTGIIGCPVN